MLGQQNHQLTIQESAAFLNVSRPFVIKEVEAGRLKCRKVGRHRRLVFTELRRYQGAQRLKSERGAASAGRPVARPSSGLLTADSARYMAPDGATCRYRTQTRCIQRRRATSR